ncbi:MAG: MobC family plasmid mobilization relaxosome protein [Rhodocyclaceae bacterium]|nr:MobC family plasmid mobilization relaxosome protein [Rhodocyclaceae bacterium]
MGDSEVLKTRVASDLKLQAKAIADSEFLSEAAWLKRLVLREIRCARRTDSAEEYDAGRATSGIWPSREARSSGARNRPIFVRLKHDDRLLLDARSEARGMRPATYVAVLTRSHLRHLAPLPKDELLALRRSIGELAAIGRNLNQIARAANDGGRLPGHLREEFRAMLKVCEALRDHTKAMLKANLTSWESGHGEDL